MLLAHVSMATKSLYLPLPGQARLQFFLAVLLGSDAAGAISATPMSLPGDPAALLVSLQCAVKSSMHAWLHAPLSLIPQAKAAASLAKRCRGHLHASQGQIVCTSTLVAHLRLASQNV